MTAKLAQKKRRQVVPTAAGDRTKEKILAAAEHLFSLRGYDGVSMRDIGREAEVPFALVTYHFETKVGLYKALFRWWHRELTIIRLDRLKAVAFTGNIESDFHQIAKCLVEPLVELRLDVKGLEFARIVAREVFDPAEAERGIVAEYLDPIALEVIRLLRSIVPRSARKKVYWAFYFASAALSLHSVNSGRLERLSEGACTTTNTPELKKALTDFITSAWIGMLSTNLPATTSSKIGITGALT